jgi:hypothetical protein
VTVEGLLPGKNYTCFGTIHYQNFQMLYEESSSTPTLLAKTDDIKVMIIADVDNIQVILETFNPTWNMKVVFKQNTATKFDERRFESEKMTLQDLDMATEYEIRISVDDDSCETDDSKCHTITKTMTKVGRPHRPSNVNLKEAENSTLELNWSPPIKYSGTDLTYNVTIVMKCIVPGRQVCTKFCNLLSQIFATQWTNYTFKGRPYMNIEAYVAAVNSVGNGDYEKTTIQTNPKAKDYENINITIDAKEIQVSIWPGCPFTGSFNFIIELISEKVTLDSVDAPVNEGTYIINYTFKNLVPVTNYNVCVMANKLGKRCNRIKTKLIPPESAPFLTLTKNTNQLIININKTNKIYADVNEFLIYNITTESKCIQKVPDCPSTKCSSSCKITYFNKSSELSSFTERLLQTDFNQQYRVRGSVINSAGEGEFGSWSNWVESFPAKNEDFKNLKTNFSLSTSENSISVRAPICPFIGN